MKQLAISSQSLRRSGLSRGLDLADGDADAFDGERCAALTAAVPLKPSGSMRRISTMAARQGLRTWYNATMRTRT
ncbi:hypothetical protein BN2497_6841 [Janthinobacterium sp. CG23_2]|nr:hypothetical protein BN2497_6841 [Janthinobacterium sp. CG23_2]CUU29818.1 hypothetical protein BN3177_6841 [Janthinobacterium sp. CG23_2]